jgi:uncharacterized protein YndB with AHSA1/START domain
VYHLHQGPLAAALNKLGADMDTIIHALEIEVPPEKVFRAVATADGLSRWWSTQVTSDERVGGIVDFTFIDVFNPDMEIFLMEEPSRVIWKCVGGHDPWHGSEFHFDIEDLGERRSRLVFKQTYGKPIDDVNYGIYNFNWGYYLQSLKDYVETGSGRPHDPGN